MAALGISPPPKGTFADHLARQGSPPERAHGDGGDFRSLLAISHRTVAGRGQQESHADLVHGEERRIRSVLSDEPGQRNQAGDHVRQSRHQAEQRVFLGDRADHVMRDFLAKRVQTPRQRQHQILALPHDAPDAVLGSFRIEGKSLGGPQERGFVDLDVAGRPAAANQNLDRFSPALRREVVRCEELLHLAERFAGRPPPSPHAPGGRPAPALLRDSDSRALVVSAGRLRGPWLQLG